MDQISNTISPKDRSSRTYETNLIKAAGASREMMASNKNEKRAGKRVFFSGHYCIDGGKKAADKRETGEAAPTCGGRKIICCDVGVVRPSLPEFLPYSQAPSCHGD